MTSPKPHYLLFCDGNVSANGESVGLQRGRWRFVLEDLVSGVRVEATDQENACAPDRSALVAVLRGLEALEQPSRVTLVTTSRYVTRGLQYGLSEWRDNDYSWEHFGTVQPIRNADIWKRIDRALAYHQVQCRWMAQEGAAESPDESLSPMLAPQILAPQTAERQVTHTASGAKFACLEAKKSTILQNTIPRSRVALPLAKGTHTMNFEGRNQIQAKFRGRLPLIFQSDPSRGTRLLHLLMLPVQLARRGPICLCSHLWDVILAIDEWLESFLRCLFLLDPSKRASRR